MEFKRLIYQVEDQIATVTLNRADKLNAFDMEMFEDLLAVQKQIAADRTLRAVIVTGAGQDFSSGLDLKSIMTNKAAAFKLLWKWWPGQANLAQLMSVGWRRIPIPVVMAIHGRCWGAGMQTALGGDFRFATPDSSLAIMESRWGLIPDMGGSLALKEIVTIDQALDWTMSSREISATEALKHNLITRIEADPYGAAQKFCRELKAKSPDAIAAIKKLYHFAWEKKDSKLLAKEWMLQWKMLLSKNRAIAVKKALGKSDREYLARSL